MRIGSVIAMGIFFLGLCCSALAAGSVTYNEVRKKVPPAMRDHLEAAFELADIGSGTRLGRHFKALGGARIGPYTFNGQSKLSGQSGYEITIHTKVQFVDAAGKVTEDPGLAATIDESFLHYEVSRVDGDGGAAAEVPPALAAGEREKAIARARESYNDVVKADLKFTDAKFERDEISGSIRRGFASSGGERVLRKVEWLVATGDHGGFKAEVFCDADGTPSFVLWEDSSWKFDPQNPGKTIDRVSEKRFYFSPRGQVARSLEKSFKGSDEAELLKNRDRATNVDYPVKPAGAAVFFDLLKRLGQVPDAELIEQVDKFLGAWESMKGSAEGR